MALYAVIDVGTNSVKFHIGEKLASGSWRTVVDRAEVTRLGEGLRPAGDLAAPAMERTLTAVCGMAAEARQHGVAALLAVGTMGLRTARNSALFLERVRSQCAVEIEVISGDEEGRLAYLAVQSGLGLSGGSIVIFDTGGGSTQFTFGHGAAVDERFSLDVGAARLTEEFALDGVLTDEQLARALAGIASEFGRIDDVPSPETVVGMGGAVTNLTAVKLRLATYDSDAVQGAVLERAEVDRQIELYRTRGVAERREIVGLQPKRADVILAGACVVRTVLVKLRKDSLRVSDRGVRHGLLADRFG
jgi:exopolyphosphatase / guanosine-5'-triphosphate,3'-diphosphate pyrophosphatase